MLASICSTNDTTFSSAILDSRYRLISGDGFLAEASAVIELSVGEQSVAVKWPISNLEGCACYVRELRYSVRRRRTYR